MKKQTRTPFDESEFHDKVQVYFLEYMGELQKTTDKKSEIFIQVNYFNTVLNNAMEYLLKTNKARGIKPHQIIDILFERKIINNTDAINANKIIKIKNLYSHQNDSPHMMRNVAQIINKIELKDQTNHSTKELNENTEWDIYQKLDLIIYDLIGNIQNKISNKND